MKFKRYLLVLLSMIAFAIVANSLVAIAMTRSNGNFLSALAAIVGGVSIIITGILVAFVITEFLKEEGKKILWFVLFVSIIGICLSVAYVFPFLKSYGSNINAFILITTAIFGMGNLYRNPVRI